MHYAAQLTIVWVFFAFMALQSRAEIFDALPKEPAIPKDNPMTQDKIKLGHQLYFDTRLSVDDTVSCNTCHNVMWSGTDNRSASIGVKGAVGDRNSPTVWNAAYLSAQFWDGRAPTLEEQAKGPLINPVEMGMKDHQAVVDKVKKIPGYVEQFKKVFGTDNAVTIDNLAKAIAAYERTLLTPNSPFDLFMMGNKSAISEAAKRGFVTVQKVGCVSCHMGPMFAGPPLPAGTPFLQKFPKFSDNEYVKKYALDKDLGLAKQSKLIEHKNLWRVPSWRNISMTGPYFHNGSVMNLDEAVRVMAKTQLNKDLKNEEVADIVAFLTTLTAKAPQQTIPALPK